MTVIVLYYLDRSARPTHDEADRPSAAPSPAGCTCRDPRISIPPCPKHPEPHTCGAPRGGVCKPGGCGWCARHQDAGKDGAA